MLSRRHRLPGFCLPQVLKGQTVFLDPDLVIKAVPNGLLICRLAVVVSKRNLVKAVGRNRLRRRLLAVIDPKNLPSGFDVVVLVRKAYVG